MIQQKLRFFLIFTLAIIGLLSCKKDSKVLPTDILSFWKFKGYEINGVLEENPETLSIDLYIGSIYSDGNDFEGASTFRNYWGRFKLDGNKIHFNDFKVTNVLTKNDSVIFYNTEKRYLNSLKDCYQYKVENNTLILEFGIDSLLIFNKSSNTIYQDSYEFTALYNNIEWKSDSNKCRADIESYGTTSPFYTTLHGAPILKFSDGNLYDLSIQLYYPPKVGEYNENGIATIQAYSFIDGDPNTNRSESSSGYVKISRVSRGFVSGEFDFHMVSNGNKLPKEFEISRGKFKLLLKDNSDKRLYIQY